jgi:hypothetical protein
LGLGNLADDFLLEIVQDEIEHYNGNYLLADKLLEANYLLYQYLDGVRNKVLWTSSLATL